MSRWSGGGRGKLILFGEHAAVYGAPATGVPLGVTTTLRLETTDARAPGADHFPGSAKNDATILRALIAEARNLEGLDEATPPQGRWFGNSDVPRSGGFGSSAALCVALARVILAHQNRSVDSCYDMAVHKLAHRLERHFHGTPSGIDTGMAADDGLAAWYPEPPETPRRVPLKAVLPPLVYGALPRLGDTAGLVANLRRRRESGEPGVSDALNRLGEISDAFIRLASSFPQDGAPYEAAKLVQDAQNLLGYLGLSTPDMEALFSLAGDRGALAGKLSGAGGGGAFFLIADGKAGRDRLLRDLPSQLSARGIALTVPLTALDVGGSG